MRATPASSHALTGEPSSPSDGDIERGIRDRQAWAADALYDRVYTAVDHALRRVLRHRAEDFDDLVQVTFERLVLALQAGRFAGACALSTFAAAIAANVAVDALRSRVRERALFPGSFDSVADEPGARTSELLEHRLEARVEVERIQRVLARMQPDHARTLVLHDVLGHNLAEVAAITGVSLAAAQSRLVRGRKEFLRRAGGQR